MKKILLFSFLLVAASASFAQTTNKDNNKSRPSEKPKSLKLTNEQLQKLKEINGANRIAQKKINDDITLTASQKSQKIQELKNGQLEKLSKFLTPDQLEQFKNLKKED